MSAMTRPSLSIWIVLSLLAASLSAQNLIQNGKTYKNPLNTTFTPFQDTNAFATCP